MGSNLDQLITSYLNEALDNFISNLESSLEFKGSFTEEEKRDFIMLLAEVMELAVGYEDLIAPAIKDKITNIKHILLESNTVHEGEEHLLNTQPLSDIQEN
jgi:hypothetical protein